MKFTFRNVLVIIIIAFFLVSCSKVDIQNESVSNKNTESSTNTDGQENRNDGEDNEIDEQENRNDKEENKLNEEEHETNEQVNESDEEENKTNEEEHETNEQVDESDEEENKPDEEEQDEELQEIISLIKYADSLKFKITEDAEVGEIIGFRGHLESMLGEVRANVGKYDTYEKVKSLLCEYYEEELIKGELLEVNLINISGEIGRISTQSQG